MIKKILTLTGNVEIDFSLIHYLDYEKNIITLKGDSVKYLVRGSLSSLSSQLSDTFVSIDRSRLINVLYVDSLSKDNATVLMKNGESFSVSRRKQNHLRGVLSRVYSDLIPSIRIEA
ncbi:LytTR family transcriptional regulator DNA-binding domain-containing protein [Halosquirtibacter laminarini]|uniref:LytTR family transcriptional regulator DNA-binding domain-containing protein n=1 Tax=Halosquirtibacter laminarini TaxID=3374600 RepID=A0AC61NNN9_9BACT|nr:LytTR family transcriptional regulator DNA-binding domain-containing protein [Prolixibacteraceae bacterium]